MVDMSKMFSLLRTASGCRAPRGKFWRLAYAANAPAVRNNQLQRQGSNLRPSGYEPDELPLLHSASPK